MFKFVRHRTVTSSFNSEQAKRITWKYYMSVTSFWIGWLTAFFSWDYTRHYRYFLQLVTKSKCAITHVNYFLLADPGGRTVKGFCLWQLAFWNCGFKTLLEEGRRSLFNVASLQVEISATGRFLVQKSRSDGCVSECDHESSIIWWSWPTSVCCVMKKILFDYVGFYIIFDG